MFKNQTILFISMYSPFQIALKYVTYFFRSLNGNGHGIHSPFVYNFVRNVLNDKRQFYSYHSIEILRNKCLHDKRVISVQDFGAGSASGAVKQKTIASITRNTSKPLKYAQLIHRIVHYFQPTQVLELGTSVGISTAYIASAIVNAKVISCEGSESVATIAEQNFESLSLRNIEVVLGTFDETLPLLLDRIPKLDLVFVDGNHRREPTLRYFEQLKPNLHENSVLIFDDIHWSAEMEQAWTAIKADRSVTCTIELFFLGLVFFRPEFKEPQHFTIRF